MSRFRNFRSNRRRFTPRRDDENVSDADGVDAIKDANAMAGRRPYDPEGYHDAKRRGWLGDEPEDDYAD